MEGLNPTGISRQTGASGCSVFWRAAWRIARTRAGPERGRGPAEMECRLCRPPAIQAAMEAASVSDISSD